MRNINGRILDLVLSNVVQGGVGEFVRPVSDVNTHHPPLLVNFTLDDVTTIKEKLEERYNFY